MPFLQNLHGLACYFCFYFMFSYDFLYFLQAKLRRRLTVTRGAATHIEPIRQGSTKVTPE